MSSNLGAYSNQETSLFEGRVREVEYYTTSHGDVFALVFVSGVVKPLAVPVGKEHKYTIPSIGNHLSIKDVTEGQEWFFVGHRSLLEIKPADFHVWHPKTKVTRDEEARAEGIILGYLKEHDDKGCSPNDVRHEVLNEVWPDRDKHIVGVPFLRLSKKGLIHKYASLPSDDPTHHGSEVSQWHLTEKGKRLLGIA